MTSDTQVRNIIVSGLTAAGKTTHAKLLALDYGLQYVSASTTLLRLAGLPLEQPLDFWVTPAGHALSGSASWQDVDDEFRRIEAVSDGVVFDCLSLPWLRVHKCLAIWLESSLSSRVMKARISHKGGHFTDSELRENIETKDNLAQRQMAERYGVDFFHDKAPFDLVVDISEFITAPTESASRVSISQAHEIITNAAGWYLNRDQACGSRLAACVARYGRGVMIHYPQVTLANGE